MTTPEAEPLARPATSKLTRALRFGALSGLSFVLNLGISAGLHELAGLPEKWSVLFAFITVFFTNFFGLRYFVFEGSDRSLLRQLLEFAASSGVFRLGEYFAFLFLFGVLGLGYMIALPTVIAVGFVVKFVFYQTFIFKSRARQP